MSFAKTLNRDEMKSIMAGREKAHECDEGIHCTCDGQHSCVSSVQECWDSC